MTVSENSTALYSASFVALPKPVKTPQVSTLEVSFSPPTSTAECGPSQRSRTTCFTFFASVFSIVDVVADSTATNQNSRLFML